jgi:hypothetical protein
MTPHGMPPYPPQPGQMTPHGMPAYQQQPVMTPPGMNLPVVQHPFGAPQRSTRSFDMGRMAAREATIRKVVWIIVLVVGTAVGIILATQL